MTSSIKMLHPRDEIVQTMERIYHYRMTTTSGGNLSIRDGQDVWITPARIDKGNLNRKDIICIKPDGSSEGPHAPSSESPFHQAIYEARPDIQGIVHAHPVALVAFSVCKQVPNTRLFHQARSVCGEAGFVPYGLPGSKALAQNIVEIFKQGFDCAIMENHGVVIGAKSLQLAFQKFETLEFTAKTIIKANSLGEIRYLTDEQIAMPRQQTKPLPSFQPGIPSSHEKELRRELCDFVRRGYQQRLLISTEGSFSARLSNEAFLITPYQVDRKTVDLDDIVLIQNGESEAGKIPSRACRNHQAIYKKHPKINAIVNAYTVNATAFSVTGVQLDSRTIPESYIFLRDGNRIPYGVQFGDPEHFADCISYEEPIAIQENDGVLVVGSSILDTFDRLEVLESTAEAIINTRPLGDISPMPDSVIDELRAVFLKK